MASNNDQASGLSAGEDGSRLGAQPGGLSTQLLADLFRSERPRLSRLIGRRIRDPDEVADLLQDAFERLARARPSGLLRTPAAYLQRVVRNLMLDRVKRAEHRFLAPDVAPCERPETAVPAEQAWALEANDLLRRYRAALASLPPRTRDIFLLHRVDELRYRDIATRFGITEAGVEYHMSRALAHLDRLLDDR